MTSESIERLDAALGVDVAAYEFVEALMQSIPTPHGDGTCRPVE